MASLSYSESIVISRSAEALYDLISDVTRMGEHPGMPLTLAAIKRTAELE